MTTLKLFILHVLPLYMRNAPHCMKRMVEKYYNKKNNISILALSIWTYARKMRILSYNRKAMSEKEEESIGERLIIESNLNK